MEKNAKIIENYFEKSPVAQLPETPKKETPQHRNKTIRRNNKAFASMQIFRKKEEKSPISRMESSPRGSCIYNVKKLKTLDFANSMKKQVHDQAMKKFMSRLKVEAKKIDTAKKIINYEVKNYEAKQKEEEEKKKSLKLQLNKVLEMQTTEM